MVKIVDRQYLADNIEEAVGGPCEHKGNIFAIIKYMGDIWLQFYCTCCSEWKTDGLEFKNGLRLCFDCLTESDQATGTLGSCIKVLNGGYIDLRDPDPKLIDIRDIAAGLSNISRYSGQLHTERWYSVAEHSVNCYYEAMKRGYSQDECLAVLMHDATEAYLGDVSKPLKQLLPVYRIIEAKFQNAIALKFDIDFESKHNRIKAIDSPMLIAERFHIYGDDGVKWSGQETLDPVDIDPKYYKPMDIEAIFLRIYKNLQ